METNTRSVAKAISWQLLGLLTMTALAWWTTGDLRAAGGLAAAAGIVGFLCYILHERLWARIPWGRSPGGAGRV
jgi:uncharacterized membrane protein